MPTTDDDAKLIASMPPGTRVVHLFHGPGVVANMPTQFGQIPVWPDGGRSATTPPSYYYPSNLEPEPTP